MTYTSCDAYLLLMDRLSVRLLYLPCCTRRAFI